MKVKDLAKYGAEYQRGIIRELVSQLEKDGWSAEAIGFYVAQAITAMETGL